MCNDQAQDFTQRPLAQASFRFEHAALGRLDIQRDAKPADNNRIDFHLTYTASSGQAIHFAHAMYIVNRDSSHGQHSTFGYGDISMPDAMQHLGIGYVYHAVAALTAGLLGVEYLAVDTAVSEPMRRLCQRIGMQDQFVMESYEGAPGTVLTEACARFGEKGWQGTTLTL